MTDPLAHLIANFLRQAGEGLPNATQNPEWLTDVAAGLSAAIQHAQAVAVPGVARDRQGRTIGTMHDFQGWCGRTAGHQGAHAADATETGADHHRMCGMPVALIGDVENWKPAELVEVPNVSPAGFEAFKTRWREQHGPPSGDDWASAMAHFDDLKFMPEPHDPGTHGPDGYAPDVDQRIADLPDTNGTLTDDADGRSP